MSTRVNYIAAFYIGDNRSSEYYQKAFYIDPLYFFRRHLRLIDNLDNITRFSFVINNDVSDVLKNEIISLANNKNLDIFFRENSGYSYGAWNDVILHNLNDYDYFFLIEDDYIPADKNFVQPFVNKLKNNVCYVCSLAAEISSENNYMVSAHEGKFKHPSISNGMISANACRNIFKNYKSLFRIKPGKVKDDGYWNQIYFLKNFTEQGYDILDTTEEYSSPYLNSSDGSIVIFGDPNLPPLLEPILI